MSYTSTQKSLLTVKFEYAFIADLPRDGIRDGHQDTLGPLYILSCNTVIGFKKAYFQPHTYRSPGSSETLNFAGTTPTANAAVFRYLFCIALSIAINSWSRVLIPVSTPMSWSSNYQ